MINLKQPRIKNYRFLMLTYCLLTNRPFRKPNWRAWWSKATYGKLATTSRVLVPKLL